MKLFAIGCCLLMLLGCEKTLTEEETNSALQHNNSTSPELADNTQEVIAPVTDQTEFVIVEWEQLIPFEELEAILNPPEYIEGIIDGSIEDQVQNSIQKLMNSEAANNAYEQALVSTNVITEMDGKNVRIPGFIVPIEFIGEKKVSKFFLVPYFGACLHMPPPPPNQIVYVETEHGITLESLYDPFWVSGKLSTKIFADETAKAAYTMQMVEMELYDE